MFTRRWKLPVLSGILLFMAYSVLRGLPALVVGRLNPQRSYGYGRLERETDSRQNVSLQDPDDGKLHSTQPWPFDAKRNRETRPISLSKTETTPGRQVGTEGYYNIASRKSNKAAHSSQQPLSLFSKSDYRSQKHNPSSNDTSGRFIVYYCDHKEHCGGWADRQRGMLSVLLLSRVTDRKFKIDMRTPCNLTNFLQPIDKDWWGSESAMDGATVAVLDDMRHRILPSILKSEIDLNLQFPQSALYVRTNRDVAPLLARSLRYRHLLPAWALNPSQFARFKVGWRLMATPTPALHRRLQALLRPLTSNHNYVGNQTLKTGRDKTLCCAHVRIGRNPTIPNDPHVRYNTTDVQTVFDFLKEQLNEEDNSYAFVATDDQDVRVMARNQFGTKLLDHGGKIVHIDRQGRQLDACAGFESALLDQLVLSECHVLVMSQSGFSLHAAYLREHTGGLYILRNGAVHAYQI